MHELEVLLSRLKMEHLSYHVESLLEQAGLAFVERSENVILLGLQV